jgi:predicted Zn-dependent peptidase
VINFYERYYCAKNISIGIVGNVPNWKNLFIDLKLRKGKKAEKVKVVVPAKPKRVRIKREVMSCYVALGFPTVPQLNKESYVFDVIDAILGRGQSGKLFTELRSKRGLAYEVGSEQVAEKTFGFFSAYAIVDVNKEKEVEQALKEEFRKLVNVSKKDVAEAKTYIEGDYLIDLALPDKYADQMLYWEELGKGVKDYLKEIKKVDVEDVRNTAKKFLNKPTVIILHP